MTRAPRRAATWYRLLISLWGVWFATVLTEPAGLMACPLHSGDSAQHAVAATPDAAHTSHTAHQQDVASQVDAHGAAGHGTHAAHAADEPTPPDGGHQCCTCLGQCCAAAPSAIVAVMPTIAVGLLRAIEPFSTVHAVVYTPRRAHALPFANGPPALV